MLKQDYDKSVSSTNRVAIIAAVITTIGVIVAAVIGNLPELIKLVQPSQTPTLIPTTPNDSPPATTEAPLCHDRVLVAHYPFNGNAFEITGGENDGQVMGAILVHDRDGFNNSAYRFDGEDDSITILDSPCLHITEEITLSAWIMPTSQKSQQIIVKGSAINGSTAAPYALSLSATGDIVFSLRPSLQFVQLRLTDYAINEWFFVVGTYDGVTMKLYVNGDLVNERSISGSLNENSSPLLIGTRSNHPVDTFEGEIDEVRIYNYALTEAEVQQLFNQ